MSTIKAALGGGVPLVDLDKGTPIPLCLVFQLPHKLTPTNVRDGFGKGVVLDLQALGKRAELVVDALESVQFLADKDLVRLLDEEKNADVKAGVSLVLGALPRDRVLKNFPDPKAREAVG